MYKFIATCLLVSFGVLHAGQKPNIVFIFSDDHAFQSIGVYATDLKGIAQTPNIDKIGNQGIVFDRAYVTNSICGPSRATVLTGKHSHKNGYVDHDSPWNQEQMTFPKLLQAGGYQTAIIGKLHIANKISGFDYVEIMPGLGKYYNPEFIKNGELIKYTGYCTDIITDRALWWMDEGRDKNKPFMAFINYKAVHSEFEPALRHLNAFDDAYIPIPPTLFDDMRDRKALSLAEVRILEHMGFERMAVEPPPEMNDEQKAIWHKAFDAKNKEFLESGATGNELILLKYKRYMQNYLATALAMDEGIGRILDYLDAKNLTENTLVIYSSDQGFFIGEHGIYDKRFMYEESFRTPLLMRMPSQIKAGTRTDRLAQNLDFAQTILDVAGIESPKEMQGRSLVPLFKDPNTTDWRKSLYYHYWAGGNDIHTVCRHDGVITQEGEKLIDFYLLGEKEYYDLREDKLEIFNKFADPAKAERVAAMQKELENLREFYDVPAEDSNQLQYAKAYLKKIGVKAPAYIESQPDVELKIFKRWPSSIEEYLRMKN